MEVTMEILDGSKETLEYAAITSLTPKTFIANFTITKKTSTKKIIPRENKSLCLTFGPFFVKNSTFLTKSKSVTSSFLTGAAVLSPQK